MAHNLATDAGGRASTAVPGQVEHRRQRVSVQKEQQWQIDSTSSSTSFLPTPPNSRPTELHEQVEAVVARLNGQIEKTENWGRRKLAYEIGHFKEGVYVLEVINGTGELMKELDRRLKVIDQVDPPPDRARRRREEGRRPHAHQAPDRIGAPPREARPAAAAPARRGPSAGDDDDADDDRFDGVEV